MFDKITHGSNAQAHDRDKTVWMFLRLWLMACTIALQPVTACTIFELNDSGFAANAVHLLHVEPIFGGGNNGTLFVDATKFAYKCSEGGG